ncbi:alkaline phosphatase PafA [Lutibacter maritimus]|uniref:Type I phosphodiesterase / nucleotide pyrophosphatase n=1 Tax=Lutibacter maritimus TaxID=593133 RepID=A0A1I6S452_9FLAO|nr:alkaline phosphatase PafA [Lutibacter maritimus]SFS71716.1 Type I phosphodiesterase / nucleotide pyrophosphatase [Lutibacter maritimus]
MKKILFILLLSISFTQCIAVKSKKTTFVATEKKQTNQVDFKRPKLIVGVVVDQMRYDYLIKFYKKYGENGFKKLMKLGYNLENVHYNYIPTYTAVGHTSIYTGTTPTNHGIISNNWYDKYEKKSIYCVDDDRYETVGAKTGGKKSPYRMLTTTISDQLRLAQNMKGKSIGVSIKDRSAILPAGHTANAAYWFEGGDEGKFISSTFYMNELPKWVTDFNNNGKANAYLNQIWNTFYDINSYTETLPDNNNYEGLFKGKETPTFPYNLAELRKLNDNYSLLKAIPFGNSIVTDFAEATIIGENLGTSNFTDFLAISYSSTDYVGHQFGVDAKELEDTYIRMDKEIERLLIILDSNVGKDNYTLFLTADHAAVEVPAYLNSLKIPGGYFNNQEFKTLVKKIALDNFKSKEIIEDISNYQIYLNKDKLKELKLDANYVSQIIADEILSIKNVYKTVTGHTLQTTNFDLGVLQTLQNGYNQKFSGDVLFVPNPTTITYDKTGSTHGSGYSYDTHVPLIFYGSGIKKGQSDNYYPIIDIAPTITSFLKIAQTNGNTGKPIIEVLD